MAKTIISFKCSDDNWNQKNSKYVINSKDANDAKAQNIISKLKKNDAVLNSYEIVDLNGNLRMSMYKNIEKLGVEFNI